MKKNKKGFSLIELLISLIIISIIISTFTPIITKKLKHKSITISAKSVSVDCAKFDPVEKRCMMCTQDSCTLCATQINTPIGYYVDVKEGCEQKACKDKFLNCKECSVYACQTCEEGYFLEEESKQCKRNPCPADTVLIPTEGDNKGICMMSHNTQISHTSLPNALSAGITSRQINVNTNGNDYTCWGGNSSLGTTGIDNSHYGTYSGKYRMVCTYLAAKKICESYKTNGKSWRLPNNSEWTFIKNNYSTYKEALNLCSANLQTNMAQCNTPVNQNNKGCPGPTYYYCYPYLFFSGSEGSNNYSYRVHFSDTTLTITNEAMHPLWTSSVRCVFDN